MKKQTVIRILLSIGILAIGFMGMRFMILNRKNQEKQTPVKQGALVETLVLNKVDLPVEIRTHGTVKARKEVDLAPQVSGRVIKVAEGCQAGGYFRQGDVLFEIDPTDYELNLEKAKSMVVKAEFELVKIESQARVARQEWERQSMNEGKTPNPLVVFEPQLKNAKAGVTSAEADVRQQELNLERTQVRAPFNCIVSSEKLEAGQLVMAGQAVAHLRGTDHAEVIIPVTFEDLNWLTVPRDGKGGSAAVIELNADGHKYTWQGSVSRSLGEVDPQGRMMRLVVEIPDPYGLESQDRKTNLFLADGLFVEVVMTGRQVKQVFEIPSQALREGNSVWLMNEKGEMEVREVELVRNQGEMLIIRGAFESGDALVLTYLPGAVAGTRLRVQERS